MRSIQSRLGAGLLLSLILAFTGLWLLVSMNLQYLAREYVAARLEHDAETLLNAVSFDDRGRLAVDRSRINLVYNQPFSGHYYVIVTPGQQSVSRSLWDYRLQVGMLDTGSRRTDVQAGPDEQQLLVLSAGYSKQGHRLSISVAEDLGPIYADIGRFRYRFAALAVGMLLLLLLLQAYILRRSLEPVRRMHKELKLLQQGKRQRLGTAAPAELRPLIDEVNDLLVIMEKRLRRSRDSLSDLAHAIKKPLTVMQQLIDGADMSDESRRVLAKQVDAIYRLSDRILRRARLSGHGHSGVRFDFRQDLPALLKTLDMIYADNRPVLDLDVKQDTPCAVEREDMLELLGNLLDNAYKWSAGQVRLAVCSDDALHITIEDNGPGADDEEIRVLAARGVRLDEDVQGHGFGLAIAADIISDYDGQLHFGRSSRLGGFKVDICLPLVR